MSVDGTKVLFEGFLQKRKDTMKIRWATYWFRLQNTTLFFYTQKHGCASHLRGYYYIHTVQSVREIQKANGHRYMFEIIMKNGKRKMLAADTAGLRRQWVGHLWQAMRLSTSVVSYSTSAHSSFASDQQDRNSSMPLCSRSESVMEMLLARPLSAPAPSDHIHEESWSTASPISTSQELNSEDPPMDQNTAESSCKCQDDSGDYDNTLQWSSELSNTECRQDGDYDILPLRNQMREVYTSAEMDGGVYDYPLSYGMATEHQDPTESIYDVPSSLLRLEDTTGSAMGEEQPQEGIYWRI